MILNGIMAVIFVVEDIPKLSATEM